MSELTSWIAEEFVFQLSRDIADQQRVVDEIEMLEHLSLDNHMIAIEERRKLRRLQDARRRLRKDVQPRLF